MTAPKIGIYLALIVVRNAKGYDLSSLLSSRQLLCYAHADGPQFTVSSPLLESITNQMPTPWARSLSISERCPLLFSPGYMRFLRNVKNKKQ